MLTELEHQRYHRHLLLSEIGAAGQLKLKASKVLVIGAGGLGCPVVQYLVAAGVGTLGIVDNDQVSFNNLQRQVLYDENDIGKYKVDIAAQKLSSQNSAVCIEKYPIRLLPTNVTTYLAPYDYIVDCTDNFETRYLINDACVLLGKPWIYGSIHRFQGQVSVFNQDHGDRRGPTLRCLYPVFPENATQFDCSTIGVLGVLPGLIGTMQATEVLKLILGIGETLSGRLLQLDALTMQIIQLEISRNNSTAQLGPTSLEDLPAWQYQADCQLSAAAPSITYSQLLSLMQQEKVLCLDVRGHHEGTVIFEGNTIRIPVNELQERVSELDPTPKILCYCTSGLRSAQAIQLLSTVYAPQALYTLKGGLAAYPELQKHI